MKDLWSFATQEYGVVDDFESYTDEEGSRIYEAWTDGFGTTTNGSQVGSPRRLSPSGRLSTGASSRCRCPMTTPAASPVEGRTDLCRHAQDWTRAGIATLAVYFGAIPMTPRASSISR